MSKHNFRKNETKKHNETNCCLKSSFRSIQKQAKQSFVLMQYNEKKYVNFAGINEINYYL